MKIPNLYILDTGLSILGVLSNQAPNALPFYNDVQSRSLDDHTNLLQFTVPASDALAENITAGNYILYPQDQSDNYRLYYITEVAESKDNEGRYVKDVYCEVSAQNDLIKDVVRSTTISQATLEQAVKHILEGTDYKVGEIEDFGYQDVEFKDYPTKLQALYDVAEQFGAELDFRVKTKRQKVVAQYIDMAEELGEVTGKPFIVGRDITGVERVENRESLITALIPVGKNPDDNNLEMTLVGANLTGVPEGYTVVGDTIYSDSAMENYTDGDAPIIAVYKDSEATNQQELFENALSTLQANDRPKMTYKISVVLLERLLGYQEEHVGIGDSIYIIDKTLNPELYLKARVRKLTRSLTDPHADACEFGDFIPITPTVSGTVQKLQAKITKQETVWNNASKIPGIEDKLENIPTRDEIFTLSTQRLRARYVRDWVANSDADASTNRWTELQVFHKGINIAKGIVPTASSVILSGSPEYVTDEILDADRSITQGLGLNNIVLDLGQVYEDIEYVHVWHDLDNRTYGTHMVDISEDGSTWVRIYNSTHSEGSDGILVAVNSSTLQQTTQQKVIELVQDVQDLEDYKVAIGEKVDQKVDLVDYNANLADLRQDISSRITAEEVDGKLVLKADIEDVNNAVAGLVSKTDYQVDKDGFLSTFDTQATAIQQAQDAITLKADSTKVDELSGQMTAMDSELQVVQEGLKATVTKSEAKDIARRTEVISGRYLRLYHNGNLNDGNLKIRSLKVMAGGVDIAKGILPTTNATESFQLSGMTDDLYATVGSIGSSPAPAFLQLDLGQVRNDIDYVDLYMYAPDEAYSFNVMLSEDAINWQTFYDSDEDGLYKWTAENEADGFKVFINEQRTVSNMMTELAVTAEGLESKVSKDGIISSINQSAEQVKISADKVTLEGSVTFESLTPELQEKVEAGGLTEAEVTEIVKSIPVPQSRNFVKDGSFIKGFTNYATAGDWGYSRELATVTPLADKNATTTAVVVKANGTVNTTDVYGISQYVTGLLTGETYTLSMYFRTYLAVTTLQPVIKFSGTNTGNVQKVVDVTTLSDRTAWNRITLTFRAQDDSGWVYFGMFNPSTLNTNTHSLQFGTLQLEPGSSATPFMLSEEFLTNSALLTENWAYSGTTTIDGGKIQADTIKVKELSALSSNLGTISGGSMNIGSGKFVVDASGNLTAKSGTFSGNVKGATVEGSVVKSSDNTWDDYTNRALLDNGKIISEYDNSLGGTGKATLAGGSLTIAGSEVFMSGMPDEYNTKNSSGQYEAEYWGSGIDCGGSDFFIENSSRFGVGFLGTPIFTLRNSGLAGDSTLMFGNYAGDGMYLRDSGVSNTDYFSLFAKSNAHFRLTEDSTGYMVQSMRIYDRTYSQTANLYITSSGTIGRVTSARKYKLDIQEATDVVPKNILSLKPMSWYDKAYLEQYAEYQTAMMDGNLTEEELSAIEEKFNEDKVPLVRSYGLIAEDVEQAGLPQYVVYEYNEDGTKEIEGISYDRLWIPLIPIVKEHEDKIAELESKVAQQDDVIAQLMARVEALESK